MIDKIDVSCRFCDADYTIKHDLNPPYKMEFCAFCGEQIDEDYVDAEIFNDDEELDDW